MTTFSDDFNRADGDPGANWVQVSGTWSIVSNQLSPGSSGATIIIRAATSMATSDHSAQVTIAATTAVSQGVMCRGDSTLANGYLWRNNGTNWGLFKAVSGTFTAIGTTYAAAAAAGDVAKIQVIGSTVKGFVNGVERASVTDTSVTSGTNTGIRSQSTSGLRYDDFSAADVVSGATLPIASSVETAQTLTGAKAATLAIAAEVDGAQAMTGAKTAALAPAGETDAAQSLAGTKTAALVVAGEQDAAQALAGTKAALLGAAGSVEDAQPLPGVKTATLTTATEVDTAQDLTAVKTATLTAASSVETAMPLVGVKTALLPTAHEVDTARPLTVPSTNHPSLERTFRIPAERRRLAVAAEHRTLTIRR